MNIEDRLGAAWQAETGGDLNLDELTARVRRQQRRRQWQRLLELLLSLLAIAVFSHAMITHGMRPAHWLLLPFFAVFLPVVWMLVLRAPRRDVDSVSAATQVYAQLRMAQLQTSLRDLRLASRSAQGLLIYAVLAVVGTWACADVAWRESALALLSYALLWWVATLLLVRRLCRRWQREQLGLQALLRD